MMLSYPTLDEPYTLNHIIWPVNDSVSTIVEVYRTFAILQTMLNDLLTRSCPSLPLWGDLWFPETFTMSMCYMTR